MLGCRQDAVLGGGKGARDRLAALRLVRSEQEPLEGRPRGLGLLSHPRREAGVLQEGCVAWGTRAGAGPPVWP